MIRSNKSIHNHHLFTILGTAALVVMLNTNAHAQALQVGGIAPSADVQFFIDSMDGCEVQAKAMGSTDPEFDLEDCMYVKYGNNLPTWQPIADSQALADAQVLLVGAQLPNKDGIQGKSSIVTITNPGWEEFRSVSRLAELRVLASTVTDTESINNKVATLTSKLTIALQQGLTNDARNYLDALMAEARTMQIKGSAPKALYAALRYKALELRGSF